MRAAGLAEVERAKADGRWDQVYGNARDIEMPKDFLRALAKDKEAKAFFESLDRANHYAIAWRLAMAKKPETRARRLAAFLAMMAEGKALHPDARSARKSAGAAKPKPRREPT